MAYFDYSANYPVLPEVLDEFCRVELLARGNANSLHEEGKKSLRLYAEANERIFALLHLDPNEYEMIYTSSATESNNLAIKGVCSSYGGSGRKIIASEFEHSSTNGAMASLTNIGAEVSLVRSTSNGKMDLNDLAKKADKNTILTCLSYVEGELGAIQPIFEANRMIHERSSGFLLVDATQAIGKIPCDFSSLDLVSFAPHKFGGIIGTGVLIKKKSIVLTPLFHGGSSVSIYRSGTPAVGLIASITKALEIALSHQEQNFQRTKSLQRLFLSSLGNIKGLRINSFDENPFIVNLSLSNKKGSEMVSLLNERGFYVSQKSACSITNTPSKAVMSVYHDKQRALNSFRVSLCSLVEEKDVIALASAIQEIANGK